VPSHVIDVDGIRPLARPEALAVAGQEYERYLDLLRSLSDRDWRCETECPPWTVQDMAAHVLGQTESIGSIREAAHQQRAAAREGGFRLDRVNAIQIRERAGLAPGEIIERLSAAAAASIRARRRLPGLVRRIRIAAEPREGVRERWSFAYLMGVIYTRDTWMHRMDTARAVDAKAVLTPAHDGRIVADIVADWARRHGEPFELVLAGPAGGSYRSGTSGKRLNLEAVEFCRLLSGRDGGGDDLLATFTPF
jgi:uncharacterized protein (TIGR03083 family)